MVWIGITGGLGSGKTTFANLLRQEGFVVLDADEIAHSLLLSGTEVHQEVVKSFGPGICTSDGKIDRKKLGRRVFQKKEELTKLEGILHPRIQKEVLRQRAELASSEKAAFYDVPLLFEKGLEKQFDLILVVSSGLDARMERLRARNQWSDEEIKSRLAAQVSIEEKAKRADFVVHNDGSLEVLSRELSRFLKWLHPKIC